jgi:ATP-dependent Clp protease ATP-binding subunit ClpB
VLLQVMDDGRLTDGQGRTVDFANAVLIMTSNLGSAYMVEMTDPEDVARERVMAAVRESFKPEFLNRLDEVLVFHRLGRDELREIVDLQLDRLRARLTERRLTLELTDGAKDWLVDHGFDPAYGARPLRRLVAKAIGDELAKRLLAGQLHEGDNVKVDVIDGRLDFGDFAATSITLS